MFPFKKVLNPDTCVWFFFQVFYVCGAIIGALIASVASDTLATSSGPTLHTALIGGFVMLWGARFAAGCTR